MNSPHPGLQPPSAPSWIDKAQMWAYLISIPALLIVFLATGDWKAALLFGAAIFLSI